MKIRRYESDLLSSNMYVVVEGKHAIVIDPFEDMSPGEGLTVDYIILTHEHYDHISGVNAWKDKTNAPVFCSRPCAGNIQDPKKNLSHYFKEFCKLQKWVKIRDIPKHNPEYSCKADDCFDDKITFYWQGHTWCLFELPGHSLGSIGILLDDCYFFSGDSLMENYEIALRFPGGSRKLWKEVGAPRLIVLSEGIQVYPGHFNDYIYAKKGAAAYSAIKFEI